METSATIQEVAKALLKAQTEMGNAIKDSKNPFFKSNYADLNSVREACMPALNKYGISIIQPTVFIDGKSFVNTVLIHESGEYLSGLTEIIYNKNNDAQSAGSGITYARRYGMQSFVNVGCEDDDGNAASKPTVVKAQPVVANVAVAEPVKPVLEKGTDKYKQIVEGLADGLANMDRVKLKNTLTPEIEKAIEKEVKAIQASRLVKN